MSIMGTIKTKAPWVITVLSIIAVIAMPFVMGGEMDKNVTMPSGNVINFKMEIPDESTLPNLVKDCDFANKPVGTVCPIEFKLISTLVKKGPAKPAVKEEPKKEEVAKPDTDIINKK